MTVPSEITDDCARGLLPCVVYAAKSSEDLHGSLATQLDDCCKAIYAAGSREIVAQFKDEAISGFKRSRGPELAAALAEAEALANEHGIAELWVQHSDRLARGDGRTARHLVEIALWALKTDVAVRCVEDTDTFRDLLYAVVTGQRNHEDSRRKGAASAAGIRRTVLRGEYAGQPLDGYRVVVTSDARGRVKKHLEINPAREALFRMIFRAAKRGAMPTAIARRANREGWLTDPRRFDHKPGPITPGFVQWVLNQPRYAGLAVYKGEIVSEGQWPAYISPREHKHLRERVRQYKSPRRPREPFLLARLAICGVCGRGMYTLAGRTRKDGTCRRSYLCFGKRTRQCAAPPLDAIVVDHVLVASLDRFLGGLEETEPYRPSPGFPRELIRGHDNATWENIQPVATITTELRSRISHALRMAEDDRAETLIDELLEHRERLRAALATRPTKDVLNIELSQDPRKLLFDFYAWSANDLSGRIQARPEDTARLNRILRRWFTRIALRPTAHGIEIAPTLAPGAPTRRGLSDPVPAYANPDQWQTALRMSGYGHRHGDRWGEAETLYALRAWASANGRAPHITDWAHASPDHPNYHIVIGHFGRWNQGLTIAGLTPTPPQRPPRLCNGRYTRRLRDATAALHQDDG